MGQLDITHFSFPLKGANQNLELFITALDASLSGIIITDNQQPDNPIIYCNKAFEDITGYTRPEIIGHNCRFLQKEDRHQKSRKILKGAINAGENVSLEIRNYKKDGTLFWNELFVSGIKDTEGNVIYFIGVQNDITRRKQAEMDLRLQKEEMEQKVIERTRSLKEKEEYLASIVHTVRESLVVLDPHFCVLTVNDHFLKTFKVSKKETLGVPLYQLGNGQWDIPKFKELLEGILPTNNPVEEFEVQHDFPHIGKKIMMVNAYRIELEGEYKDRILLAIEDVTERLAIERRKDDFLSIASHELKTPLTTIKGNMQLMKRQMPENASPKFTTLLDKSSLYVERLNDLISELLDMSRIQTGNIEIHKAEFNFDEMVAEALENIKVATTSHTFKFSGATNASVLGDESHLTQVINNLLSNAIKYSPFNTDIAVHISQVSDYVKFSVADHGVGIAQEDQSKIFERFYRVGDIQKKFPGMGIGLYVSQEIIRNHSGTIWVESEKGKGSTFNFTLPIGKNE